jgi:hypothetical protein
LPIAAKFRHSLGRFRAISFLYLAPVETFPAHNRSVIGAVIGGCTVGVRRPFSVLRTCRDYFTGKFLLACL